MEEREVLMENQQLFNNLIEKENRKIFSPELVGEIYDKLIGKELVNVQTMLGPMTTLKSNPIENVTAKTRFLKTTYIKKEDLISSLHNHDLSEDEKNKIVKEYNNLLTDEISMEITKEITNDIKNNTGTQLSFSVKHLSALDASRAIFTKILELKNIISEKTDRQIDDFWVYTNSDVASLLIKGCSGEYKINNSIYVQKIGKIDQFTLYVDALFQNEILIGFNNNESYFYCPYIMLSDVSEISDKSPTKLIARYAKRLLNDGAKYFGKITVLDVTEDES